MRQWRFFSPLSLTLIALTLSALLAACGSGGSSLSLPGSPGAPPVPPSAPTDASAQIPFAQNVATNLPGVAGYSESVTLPANNAPGGSSLAMTVSLSGDSLPPPTALHTGTTMLYFTATTAQTVALQGRPTFGITVPASVQLAGVDVRLAAYDPAAGWTDLGSGSIKGRTISLSGGTTPTTMKAATTYGFAIYSPQEVAGCPTPSPSPTPTMTPSASPSPTIKPSPSPSPTIKPSPSPTPTATPTAAAQELYVSNTGNDTVTVYSMTASGNAAPVRTLDTPGCCGHDDNRGISVDDLGYRYVAGSVQAPSFGPGIRVYKPFASGFAPPYDNVVVPCCPVDLALDSSGLYASFSNSNMINVYDPKPNFSGTPIRTISGSNTDLQHLQGIALSPDHHVAVTEEAVNFNCTSRILEFAPLASGNVKPNREIDESSACDAPMGVAYYGGNIYEASYVNQVGIDIFFPSANGAVPPNQEITGSNTGLTGPFGVTLDADGNVYVVNHDNNTITVYASGSTGNATPIRTIAGPNTGLNGPTYIAIGK